MSLLQRVCKTLGVLGLAVALPALVYGQTTNYYASQGGEYLPAGSLPGDQLNASVALSGSGGFLVWQDNITDGDGYGISAVRLDATFSPTLGNFRVNQQGVYDQENPQVALLKNGGAAFVWQGGKQSFQHIYARFLSSSNVWVTGDLMVNTATNFYQANPVIATLANGDVIITWASFGQDNADGFQGIYAQIFTPAGQKVGGEFLVNQFTQYNQRTPAVAAFPNGNFIVTWVSEKQNSIQSTPSGGIQLAASNSVLRGLDSVDIYARTFSPSGAGLTNEFLVNTGASVCANPAVSVATDGSFMIAWGQKDVITTNNSWDIFARPFSSAGIGGGVQTVNSQLYGDQFAPKISSAGTDYLVVWTSLGQDGSLEGVYGQFLHGDGSRIGGEFRVNTTVVNTQKYQTVGSDGVGQFLAVWSSYVGGANSLDLNAQRYSTTLQPLSPPAAPIVSAVGFYYLSVTWASIGGFSVDHWNLYIDSSSAPVAVTNLYWANSAPNYYFPGQIHTFQLAYVLSDGRISPLSAPASGTPWGFDGNNDGLPDAWETLYYGTNTSKWPPYANAVITAPGGLKATALQIFEWGANPNDPSTWLMANINHTPQGWFLSWNTQPGFIYQIQSATNLTHWSNLGAPRFAAGTSDSVFLGLSYQGYYRITRLIY